MVRGTVQMIGVRCRGRSHLTLIRRRSGTGWTPRSTRTSGERLTSRRSTLMKWTRCDCNASMVVNMSVLPRPVTVRVALPPVKFILPL